MTRMTPPFENLFKMPSFDGPQRRLQPSVFSRSPPDLLPVAGRGMRSRAYEIQQVRHSSCSRIVMADRYLEAVQCLDLIAPERFAEALETADARAGLRSCQEGRDRALMEIVFSVPEEQFWWFRLVLRKMADKYERHKRIVQAYRKLNSPRS